MIAAAPDFRQVCQFTGEIAEPPESSAADDFPSAADGSTPKVATSLTRQRQVGTASPAGVDHLTN